MVNLISLTVDPADDLSPTLRFPFPSIPILPTIFNHVYDMYDILLIKFKSIIIARWLV